MLQGDEILFHLRNVCANYYLSHMTRNLLWISNTAIPTLNFLKEKEVEKSGLRKLHVYLAAKTQRKYESMLS